MIRLATPADAAAVCDTYNHYVLTTSITFEEEAVGIDEMARRISETVPTLPWFVWEDEGKVAGYAYASKWKSRCAYRYSVETTIYLRHDKRGRGLGRTLYEQLLQSLREKGIHSVIGGIALPNVPSQKLHERLGFKKVAQFEEVGWKFERWIDVGYWELIFHPQNALGMGHQRR